MELEHLTATLREEVLQKGAALVSCAALPAEVKTPVPGLNSVVAYVISLRPEIVSQIVHGPTAAYCQEYDDVNRRLGELGDFICAFLRNQGFQAEKPLAVPYDKKTLEGPFPLKTAAVASGLGWIGKTDLFVCEQYGSAVRLGAVFTDAPFPPAKVMESRCGGCRSCVEACPASASKNQRWQAGMDRAEVVDIHKCLQQLYRFGEERQLKHNTICGICIANCLYTRRWLKKLEQD